MGVNINETLGRRLQREKQEPAEPKPASLRSADHNRDLRSSAQHSNKALDGHPTALKQQKHVAPSAIITQSQVPEGFISKSTANAALVARKPNGKIEPTVSVSNVNLTVDIPFLPNLIAIPISSKTQAQPYTTASDLQLAQAAAANAGRARPVRPGSNPAQEYDVRGAPRAEIVQQPNTKQVSQAQNKPSEQHSITAKDQAFNKKELLAKLGGHPTNQEVFNELHSRYGNKVYEHAKTYYDIKASALVASTATRGTTFGQPVAVKPEVQQSKPVARDITDGAPKARIVPQEPVAPKATVIPGNELHARLEKAQDNLESWYDKAGVTKNGSDKNFEAVSDYAAKMGKSKEWEAAVQVRDQLRKLVKNLEKPNFNN